MKETIIGIVSLSAGCLMMILNKLFARLVIEQQNKFWGFHFGQREIKITEVGSIITGIGFIVVGLLSLFQIIRFK
jgi:hypothetical protein